MSLIITYTAWNIETINQFLLPNIYWKTLGLWNTDEAFDSFCCLGDVEENRATRTAIIYSGLRHWMVEFFSCDIDLHIIYICKRHLLAPSPRKKCLLLMLAPFKNVLRHFIKSWTTTAAWHFQQGTFYKYCKYQCILMSKLENSGGCWMSNFSDFL